MSHSDPSTPSRKVGLELARSRKRSAETDRVLSDLDQVFQPVREVGERNHIAWKLKQALGPAYQPAPALPTPGDSR